MKVAGGSGDDAAGAVGIEGDLTFFFEAADDLDDRILRDLDILEADRSEHLEFFFERLGGAFRLGLVDATGLTRSTVHHHLALLRDAGLVALEGNARAYLYVPRPEAAAEAAALLGDILGTEEN